MLNVWSFLEFTGYISEVVLFLRLCLNKWLRFLCFALPARAALLHFFKFMKYWPMSLFFSPPLLLWREDKEADSAGASHNGGFFVYFLI